MADMPGRTPSPWPRSRRPPRHRPPVDAGQSDPLPTSRCGTRRAEEFAALLRADLAGLRATTVTAVDRLRRAAAAARPSRHDGRAAVRAQDGPLTAPAVHEPVGEPVAVGLGEEGVER